MKTTYDSLEDQTSTATSLQRTDDNINDGLPEFGWEEIANHKTATEGIWVTFGGNVYDITEFVEGHPGGTVTPLQPFGS